MARDTHRRELHDATRTENWSLHGPNRIVKVQAALPVGAQQAVLPVGAQASHVSGYITLAKFIKGMTPDRIEKALGLRVGSLASGAVIYNLARRPMSHEYDYELTANRPGGLAVSFMSSEDFPPGARSIHQWAIKEGTLIPVSADAVRLRPGQTFLG